MTGAGRGIGREVALLAAAQGARVVVNDVGARTDGSGTDAATAQQVVAEISASGGQAIANESDITDPVAAAEIIDIAVSTFGRLDAVVNNAGNVRDARFDEMSLADWKAVIDVHVHGYFNVSHAAAAVFRDQGTGRFVHFTSTSGLIGMPRQANYSAAKMAVVGLSRSIAIDMAEFGIRSNCVAPFAWSRMLEDATQHLPGDAPELAALRCMTAAKVAPIVVFLASALSRDVTGQIFAVRRNEIFLMSQSRPTRGIHRADGWTMDSLSTQLLPSLARDLVPLERSAQVFTWPPI